MLHVQSHYNLLDEAEIYQYSVDSSSQLLILKFKPNAKQYANHHKNNIDNFIKVTYMIKLLTKLSTIDGFTM